MVEEKNTQDYHSIIDRFVKFFLQERNESRKILKTGIIKTESRTPTSLQPAKGLSIGQ